jgi:hypothetical protein
VLKTTQLAKNPSVYRLVKLWAQRYVPDISTLALKDGSYDYSALEKTASPEGRDQTVAKLKRLINLDCEYAGIETNTLFSYIPNIVNLAECRQLARFVWQVYDKTLDIYRQQSLVPTVTQAARLQAVATTTVNPALHPKTDRLKMPGLEMLAVEKLATELEPVLLELQEQHLLAKDHRAIGFVNTQFHFSSKLVLKQLTPPEQVLLSPYLKFVEEQVLIPWQRVCAAAAKHDFSSPSLAIVEKLLAQSDEIASAVFHKTVQLNPNHRSRRGKLTHPGIAASTTRDMNMFQAYLWLCILEESMVVVEYELLPLCVMVLPSVEVKWELTQQMIQLLIDEIKARVTPAQKELLMPYTQALQRLFSNPEMKAGI